MNRKAIAPAVRQIVYQLDSDVPLRDVETETDLVARSTTPQRVFSELSSFFGLLALLLAAIGLNGVVSYDVKRRTNEIGIRMALGATQRNIQAMVLKETIVMVLIGVGIAIPAALELTRFIKSQLYGVKQTDPLTLSFSVFLMVAVALLSSYLPREERRAWIRRRLCATSNLRGTPTCTRRRPQPRTTLQQIHNDQSGELDDVAHDIPQQFAHSSTTACATAHVVY